MSDRFTGTIDFPEWALQIPEVKKTLEDYFGDSELWKNTWFMENNEGVIHLMDAQAPNGEFPGIQECFQLYKIPYDRWAEGYCDYEPLTEHFRPELGSPLVFDGQDRFVLYIHDIKKILDSPNLKEELMKLMPPEIKSLHDYKTPVGMQEKDMSVKEQLMALGMKEEDFGRYESDLYVRVTPVSAKFLETYQFKNQVEQFMDQIEHVPFYDFPFAAMKEQLKERELEAEHMKRRMFERNNQQHSEDIPLDGLHKLFERFEENGMHADCGDWSVGKDISAFPGWWELSFADQPVAKCVPSEEFTRDGQIGYIQRLEERISDKNFSDICDIIHSVSSNCQMAPEEQAKIDANRKHER